MDKHHKRHIFFAHLRLRDVALHRQPIATGYIYGLYLRKLRQIQVFVGIVKRLNVVIFVQKIIGQVAAVVSF